MRRLSGQGRTADGRYMASGSALSTPAPPISPRPLRKPGGVGDGAHMEEKRPLRQAPFSCGNSAPRMHGRRRAKAAFGARRGKARVAPPKTSGEPQKTQTSRKKPKNRGLGRRRRFFPFAASARRLIRRAGAHTRGRRGPGTAGTTAGLPHRFAQRGANSPSAGRLNETIERAPFGPPQGGAWIALARGRKGRDSPPAHASRTPDGRRTRAPRRRGERRGNPSPNPWHEGRAESAPFNADTSRKGAPPGRVPFRPRIPLFGYQRPLSRRTPRRTAAIFLGRAGARARGCANRRRGVTQLMVPRGPRLTARCTNGIVPRRWVGSPSCAPSRGCATVTGERGFESRQVARSASEPGRARTD